MVFAYFQLTCFNRQWTVKRSAELSTDHHLAVCNLGLEKPTVPTHTTGLWNPTE